MPPSDAERSSSRLYNPAQAEGSRIERLLSDADRKLLREAAINVAIEIDGEVYMSPNGLSSAGTSTTATMQAITLRRDLDSLCKLVETQPARLAGLLTRAGRKPPADPDLHFVFLEDGYGVFERRTQTILRLK